MFDETKLRRDIDTMRESIQLASVELATAYSPDDRRALVKHINVLQSELGDLLDKAERLGTVPVDCPFAVGETVEHAKFGPGVVTGVSGKMSGGDPTSPTGVRDTHWNIAVDREDANRGETRVAHWALKSRGS